MFKKTGEIKARKDGMSRKRLLLTKAKLVSPVAAKKNNFLLRLQSSKTEYFKSMMLLYFVCKVFFFFGGGVIQDFDYKLGVSLGFRHELLFF